MDDCSTDGTGAILEELSRDASLVDRRQGAVRMPGHGPSVLRGLAPRFRRVDFPGRLGRSVPDRGIRAISGQRRADADLVLGVRLSRQDSAHRLVLSRVIARRFRCSPNEGSATRTLRSGSCAASSGTIFSRSFAATPGPRRSWSPLAPRVGVGVWSRFRSPICPEPRVRRRFALSGSSRSVSDGLRELLAFHHRLRREPARVALVAHEVA